MIVKMRSSFTLRVIELHRPRPEGSLWVSPRAMGTRLLVARVRVPPDWKLSVSGMGSMTAEGELNDTLCKWNCFRALV